jgi:hypothetical protein
MGHDKFLNAKKFMESMKEANFPGQIRRQHIKLKARMMYDELLP